MIIEFGILYSNSPQTTYEKGKSYYKNYIQRTQPRSAGKNPTRDDC